MWNTPQNHGKNIGKHIQKNGENHRSITWNQKGFALTTLCAESMENTLKTLGSPKENIQTVWETHVKHPPKSWKNIGKHIQKNGENHRSITWNQKGFALTTLCAESMENTLKTLGSPKENIQTVWETHVKHHSKPWKNIGKHIQKNGENHSSSIIIMLEACGSRHNNSTKNAAPTPRNYLPSCHSICLGCTWMLS